MELVVKGIICASSSFVSCVRNSFNIIRGNILFRFFGSHRVCVALWLGLTQRCCVTMKRYIHLYIFVLICNGIIYIRIVWKRHNYKNKVYFKCVRYDYDMRTRVLCLNFMDWVVIWKWKMKTRAWRFLKWISFVLTIKFYELYGFLTQRTVLLLDMREGIQNVTIIVL